ncbi:hypothetical protein Gbem_3567 [Citrifermentans bemidjiense Bem]|uniref:Uncharacterized protein n=1 Tax=Citrifermentans bemidjiense (strain ATCC BAA-1014 / DSM 16622 / JCM 12645 / Bem) TaxID=404380 RepID=B5ECU2_CITBB|nr:hypothetical protein Gbem_3567 [Citrifermentans bemidjiense Bem]
MIPASEIPDYLPKYLTDHSYKELREAVKRFPEIAYNRFYSNHGIAPGTVYQGDCIAGLPYTRNGVLNTTSKCFVLSNTCDMEISENKRYFNSNILFTPIIDFKSYEDSLLAKHKVSAVENHLAEIKKQCASQIMYLPDNSHIPNGGIVFWDQIYHVLSSSLERSSLSDRRLFSLSNYGHYCMCIKLSHHLCRVTAETDRPATAPLV